VNTILQTDRGTPVVARIQKIRTRMRIEALFDVPAANKEIFLPLCLCYEQRLAAAKSTEGGEAFWRHQDMAQAWNKWKDWDDWPWTDWNKLLRMD
jgi:hypothetical protein